MAHLVPVFLDGGTHLSHRSLYYHVANHAEALAIRVERFQRFQHKLVLSLIEIELIDLDCQLLALLAHEVESRLRVGAAHDGCATVRQRETVDKVAWLSVGCRPPLSLAMEEASSAADEAVDGSVSPANDVQSHPPGGSEAVGGGGASSGDPACSEPPELQGLHTEQPLQTPWTFWFDRLSPGTAYAATLQRLGTVHTVQGFWRYYCNLTRPGQLQAGDNYHLFRGILQPAQETLQGGGGCWLYRLQRSDVEVNRLWETLLLSVIGEGLGEACVIGAGVSVRNREVVLTTWCREDGDDDSSARVGQRLRSVLAPPIGSEAKVRALPRVCRVLLPAAVLTACTRLALPPTAHPSPRHAAFFHSEPNPGLPPPTLSRTPPVLRAVAMESDTPAGRSGGSLRGGHVAIVDGEGCCCCSPGLRQLAASCERAESRKACWPYEECSSRRGRAPAGLRA